MATSKMVFSSLFPIISVFKFVVNGFMPQFSMNEKSKKLNYFFTLQNCLRISLYM
jgi:hypothetical protein